MPATAKSSSITNLKLPPHSLEAEQSVLGGLMMNNNAWEIVEELLVEDDFYRRDHRLIFRSMSTLANSQSPLDAITVSEHLDHLDPRQDAEETGHDLTQLGLASFRCHFDSVSEEREDSGDQRHRDEGCERQLPADYEQGRGPDDDHYNGKQQFAEEESII